MKAAVFRGPGRLALEDVPDPALPAEGLILHVEACGICGSDLRALAHGLRFAREWQILGHEVAGVVAQVGKDVPDYQVGERLAVAADIHCHRCYYCRRALYNLCEDWQLIGAHYAGGMAEYMALPEDILRRGIVHRIAEGLPSVHAALAEPAASVLASQHDAGVELGEVVLIIGNGPMGCLHVQVARARGAKAVLVGRRAERLRAAEGLGAWQLIDASQRDLAAEVRALTEGRGADVAIVACASREAQSEAVQLVRKRGRVILFGGLPKEDPIAHLDANRIHYDELRIMGSFSYHPSFHQLALEMIARGQIEAQKLITSTFPLSRVVEAFAAAREATQLKVVITQE
jgi:L-iditol 2-dehydrogenase